MFCLRLKQRITPMLGIRVLNDKEMLKKIIPYILILVMMIGFFSLAPKAQAQGTTSAPLGLCTKIPIIGTKPNISEANCKGLTTDGMEPTWKQNPTPSSGSSGSSSAAPTEPLGICSNTKDGGVPFTTTKKDCESPSYLGTWDGKADAAAAAAAVPKKEAENTLYNSLSSCPPVDGCIAKILYWFFYAIPSLLLNVAGNFFNVIIALTLFSDLYDKATFVGNAWVIVRDLSNIFFILVLLYIAIKTILGLGGSEVKKMIAQVIIMALLINFSMFFTKIVIDTSNILALVFYNRISVTTVQDGKTIGSNYISVLSKDRDKDMSGGMMGYFDPTRILTQDFFNNFRKKTYTFSIKSAVVASGLGAIGGAKIGAIGGATAIPSAIIGVGVGLVGYTLSGFANDIPLATSAGFIVIAGSIIIFATYCFFIAGLSFLGRLIELWVLIIFSPFAFMSSTIPLLGKIEYIGWDAWLKRLLQVSFMAPIFMFFMYLIFMIIKSNIFISLLARPNPNDQLWMETIILMVIPALIILILLNQATKFAKKGSGALGEMLIKGAKIVGGVALGATVGIAATAGRESFGRVAENLSEKQGFKDWAAKSKIGAGALGMTRGIGAASFDARGIKVAGQTLSSATGMKLGEAQKGGFTKSRKDYVEKEEKFASSLEMSDKERWERSRRGENLVYTGTETPDEARAIKARIDEINRERTLARAKKVEGKGRFNSNGIAATRIREAGKNKAKKIQDAILAVAAGGGTEVGPTGGGGARGTGARGGTTGGGATPTGGATGHP